MELQLTSHSYVEKCSVVVIDVESTKNNQNIGALIILSEHGKEQLTYKNCHVISQELERQLIRQFQDLPFSIKWHYASTFPEGSQEVLGEKVKHCFLNKYDPETKHPLLLKKHIVSDEIMLTFMVPEKLIYFSGHFPSIPIVPGVTQIYWVMHYANKYLNVSSSFSRMEVVKFHNVLVPEDHFNMKLNWQSADHTLVYRLWWKDKSISSGRLVLH